MLVTDRQLVELCLNGQKEAFGRLVERYQKPVRAAAVNIVKHNDLAADISQDAFAAAYEKLGSLRNPDAFGQWLLQITRRLALDSLRKLQKQTQLDDEAVLQINIENSNGQLDEENQHLLAAVMKLPEHEKRVVLLRYFSGNSVKELADITCKSIGTVTKQLSRAHERLREMLKEV